MYGEGNECGWALPCFIVYIYEFLNEFSKGQVVICSLNTMVIKK